MANYNATAHAKFTLLIIIPTTVIAMLSDQETSWDWAVSSSAKL